MESKRAQAILAVMIGATLFGFLGIATRFFKNDYGLNAIETVAIRLTVASFFLLLILGILARDKLRISKKDIPLLVLFGIFKISSDITYFYAQTTIHLSLATLLQLTAPYYVMVISMFLFREKLTGKKLFAMVLGTVGAVFVTGILFGGTKSDLAGLFSAMISGLFYGLFLIGSKMFNDRGIHPAASLFYVFLFADIIALPFCFQGNLAEVAFNIDGIAVALALGIMMTLVPFFLYSWSTQHLEPTVASIVSILELVVSTMVGYFVFSEDLSLTNILGMALIILSIIVMNVRIHMGYVKRFGKYVPQPIAKLYTKK